MGADTTGPGATVLVVGGYEALPHNPPCKGLVGAGNGQAALVGGSLKAAIAQEPYLCLPLAKGAGRAAFTLPSR